ncbi:phenylalanine--tRNA ligase subunit alpha [Breznakiellaceae bacterium SP9]
MELIQNVVKNLHPLEVRIIRHFKQGDELTIEKVESALGFKAGNGNQALSWLLGKGLVEDTRRETAVFYELTELGASWHELGTPEERIIKCLRTKPLLRLPEIAAALTLDNKDVGSAFGALSKRDILALNKDKQADFTKAYSSSGSEFAADSDSYLTSIRALLDRAASSLDKTLAALELSADERKNIAGIAKKRGAAGAAFKETERETVIYTFTPAYTAVAAALEAAGITGDEIGSLSPELIASGAWKERPFRPYNVQIPPTRLMLGRTNPYAKFLEDVKDKLASFGFEEFDGPLIETEFWNSDALFMPQFHSARDIHDVYRISAPLHAKTIEEPWLSNVAAAHENGGNSGSRGWNYAFDRDFTRRLILRSQGTVLSAKQLTKAKIPGKYFGIVRCFRYDHVDATHLPDFYQTEGIVLGEDVNLKTLLGMLETFAIEVAGAKEVKYVPGYFPFTEPSIEVHIKHPVLGWFELGGSGIFRPELTASMGIDVPVAAWGIGIDRMALMALGLNDLRELFSYDIESVRLRRTKEGFRV